jgi:hypothetical protein
MARPWLENSKLFPSLPWIIRLDSPSKQNAVVYSESFYTGVKGYKMCLQICPDGKTDKDFGFLSVSTMLRSGPNDNDLSWPLRQDTSITLLNQLEDRNHYTVKKEANDINPGLVVCAGQAMPAVGIAGRISHKDIYQPQTANCIYFRDDCLYIKVTSHMNDPLRACSSGGLCGITLTSYDKHCPNLTLINPSEYNGNAKMTR